MFVKEVWNVIGQISFSAKDNGKLVHMMFGLEKDAMTQKYEDRIGKNENAEKSS